MSSKVSKGLEYLKNHGIREGCNEIIREMFPPRDRNREIDGSAADLYDCFIFYNELELLDLRLNELDEVVDKFVIVEATETYQGDSKELNFDNHREDFLKFKDKIIYKTVEYPQYMTDPWEREYFLRDSIFQALREESNISHQDEVIISDADEIPNPKAIRHALNLDAVKIFSQSIHYYYYDYTLDMNSRWLGPVMSKYQYLTSPQDFRNRYTQHREDAGHIPFDIYSTLLELFLSIGNKQKVHIINNGGWHFSYLGNIDYIIDKLESFSHTELNKSQYKDPDRIKQIIKNGEDLFDQGLEFTQIVIDDSYPSYLYNNQSEFSEHILENN